ncbi:MAG: hypothetical protein ACP5G2_03615 [Candidatus Bipolaricaulaceae bacterium]
MSKRTLGYRLFGLGRLAARRRAAFHREGVRILEEGIRVRITYRHHVAPGKRFSWRRSVGSGAIALTRRRLAAFYHWRPILDMETEDARMEKLRISAPAAHTLAISFAAGDPGIPHRPGRAAGERPVRSD